jgi:hypothetical protein
MYCSAQLIGQHNHDARRASQGRARRARARVPAARRAEKKDHPPATTHPPPAPSKVNRRGAGAGPAVPLASPNAVGCVEVGLGERWGGGGGEPGNGSRGGAGGDPFLRGGEEISRSRDLLGKG